MRFFRFLLSIMTIFVLFTNVYALPRYSELYPFLIDLKGWKSIPPIGSLHNAPVGKIVTAERRYKKGNKMLYVIVLGGDNKTGILAPFSVNVHYDTSEEYITVKEIEGFITDVIYYKNKARGRLLMKIKDAGNNGVVFVMDFYGMDYQSAIEIARLFPLEDLRRVFKSGTPTKGRG